MKKLYMHSNVVFAVKVLNDSTLNNKASFLRKTRFKKYGAHLVFSILIFLMFNSNPIFAQSGLEITSTGTPFNQTFDGMGSSPTATTPTGFKIGPDWSTGTSATTLAAGTSGTGILNGTSSGGTYNFANGVTASSTDRALGFLSSGSFASPRSIVLKITNTSGATISSLEITFDYEKYRSGTRQFDWTFFHGDITSPTTSETAGNQSYAANASNTVISNPPLTTSKTVSLSGLSIPNGVSYYLRWTYTGLAGSTNAQGIGIDNFSITASASGPSEPSCIANPVAPANAATGVSLAGTTLTWTNPGTATSYDVYFGTDNPPTNIVNGTNQTDPTVTFATGALSPATTYFWRIIPRNAIGAAVGPCSIWSFVTLAPPTCIANPTSPLNGQTGIPLAGITLTWPVAPDASGYDVYFGNPLPGTPNSSNQTGLTFSTGALSASTTYSWLIVPRNPIGSASGCSTWSFTSISPPSNDNCSNAININPTTTCINTSGITINASEEFAPTSCDGGTSSSANDVWYSFISDGISEYTINASTNDISDLVLSFYSSCDEGNLISCADAVVSGTESITTGLLSAGTYFYRIYGFDGASGTFNTCVTKQCPTIPSLTLVNQTRCGDGDVTFTVNDPGPSYTVEWSTDGINNNDGSGLSKTKTVTVGSPITVYARISLSADCKGPFVSATGTANTFISTSVIYTENFGTGTSFPTGWDNAFSGTPRWSISTASASSGYPNASGGSNALVDNSAAVNSSIVSSTIDFSGLTNGVLKVGMRRSSTGFLRDIAIDVSTDDGVSFSPLTSILASDISSGSYSLITFDLGASINNASHAKIRFRLLGAPGTSGPNFRMDDVTICGTSNEVSISKTDSCDGTSTLTANGISSYSYLWTLADATTATTQTIIIDSIGNYSVTATNEFGCSSTASIDITSLLHSDAVTINETSCNPANVGTAVQTLTNQVGCDSVVTTITTLLNSDSVVINATSCDPGQVGTVVQTLTNQAGCDSVVTTITTLLNSDAVTVNATTCNPANVGTVVQTLTNQAGCDSIVTTITTLVNSDAVTVNATTCNPANVGTVVQTLTNQAGCDSIVTTITTLVNSDAVTVNATTCNPANVGTVVQTLTNQAGCDSIVTTITTLVNSDAVTVNATTCNPANVGTVVQTLTNQAGCDSIVTTITTLVNSDAVTVNATTCNPANVGTVVQTLTNQAGCDSIVTTITTLVNSDAVTVNATTCNPANVGTVVQTLTNQAGCDSVVTTITTLSNGDAVTINATSCNPANVGTVVQTLTNQAGCDSVVTTITTLLNSDAVTVNATTCNPANVGTVVQTLTNQAGCDSIVTTITTLVNSDAVTVNATTCNPANVGTIVQTLTNQAGCDSVVTTITTLVNSDAVTVNETTCNPANVGTIVQTLTNQAGCDSIVTTITTLVNSDAVTVNATTCNPANVGTVVQTLTNQAGCDSMVTTITTLVNSDAVTVNATTCNPANVGTVVQTLTNQAGCDSIVTTITTLVNSDAVTVNATTCNPANVGTVVQTLTNQAGCDSIVTTITTLLNSDAITINATTCNPANVGTVVQTLTNQAGCDSIVTTITTLVNSDAVTVNATTCNPANVGTVVQTLTNQAGCDSIVTTITTLLNSDAITVNATTCNPANAGTVVQTLTNQAGCDSVVTTITTLVNGDAVTINATSCNPANVGTVVQTLTNQAGCDSVVTTITTLSNSDAVTVNATSCNPANVGIVVQTLTNQAGCDSVVTTITTLVNSDAVTVNATTCNPANVGTVVQTLTNQAGCDSIVTTITTLLNSDAITINATTCNPANVGTVVQTLTNQAGCDSVVTTITTLLNSDAITINATTCNPANVGTVVQTLTNQAGCDSIVTTITTLSNGDAITINATTCNPANAGTVVQTLTNQAGCDSVVTTITTLSNGDTVTINATSCNPANVGTVVQTLTNQAGCDSVVTTITTLVNSDAVTVNATTCNPANVGTVVQTLTNQAGCDSVVTTITTLVNSDAVTVNATTCNPANVGTVVQTLTNQAGCDSVVTTITTLLNSDAITINATTCNPANVGTVVQTLTNQAGCDSVVTTITTLVSVRPGTPTAINGSRIICPLVVYTYFIAPVANAQTYFWKVPFFATILSGQGTTSVEVQFSVGYTVGSMTVQSINCAGTSTARPLSVSLKAKPGRPVTISGQTPVCFQTYLYSCTPVANADSYTWTAPANATILSGQGTLTVEVQFLNGFTSGNLSVAASNCGGTSVDRVKLITLFSKPATPSAISGIRSICPGTYTYSVTLVATVDSYNWAVPANATLLSGQGTSSVLVEFLTGYTTGSLTVTASNCGGTSAARTITISNTVATPSTISGLTTVCPSATGVSYTIVPVNGATSYVWEASGGASISSGQGTTSITVDFPGSYSSLVVRVKSVNSCSVSGWRSLTVSSCPGRISRATIAELEPIEIKAYPNPFISSTTIAFTVPKNDNVRLAVFNLEGRELQQLFIGEVEGQTEYQFQLNADNSMSAGIYFYRLETNNDGKVTVGKIILVK